MADQPVVHIGENSPEQVAWRLFLLVANNEDKSEVTGGKLEADRQYILDTYAECLLAVKQPHDR